MRRKPDYKTRTVYKAETITKRAFRNMREQEVKKLMGLIRTAADNAGFKIIGRITFEDEKTGEVFK